MFWGTEEKPKKLGKSKLTKTTKNVEKRCWQKSFSVIR